MESAVARVGFWVGWLELGFVFYAATWMSESLFVLWSGSGCVALMWPRIRRGVGWAMRRPTTVAERGSDHA